MGFINDFKYAWEKGKQEARMEIIREFFAYIYGVKYNDAIVSKEWYPSQYEELFNDIMDSGNTVLTNYMPHNKIDLNEAEGYVQKIIERI